MVTNRRMIEEAGPDFYPTPEWGTKALLSVEREFCNVLEPCCGDGAMARVLAESAAVKVTASDLYDRGYGQQKDFFHYKEWSGDIITNPPFNIAEDIALHALKIMRPRARLCLLLRTAFLESKKRYENIYRANPPARVWVFSERLSMYPAGQQGVNGGGTTSYAWFVWDAHIWSKPVIGWIPPGLKPRTTAERENRDVQTG